MKSELAISAQIKKFPKVFCRQEDDYEVEISWI